VLENVRWISMKEKMMTAFEAARFVEDGSHLGVGAGMAMNPMPVVREVIRRGVKGLTLTPVVTGGYVADLLIGAGCVETVQFPQVVMDEFGLAPNFRKKAERGELKLLETM
jgi:glutaconate CoA-transferase subunit A